LYACQGQKTREMLQLGKVFSILKFFHYQKPKEKAAKDGLASFAAVGAVMGGS
jgi:hypothetical protein